MTTTKPNHIERLQALLSDMGKEQETVSILLDNGKAHYVSYQSLRDFILKDYVKSSCMESTRYIKVKGQYDWLEVKSCVWPENIKTIKYETKDGKQVIVDFN